MTTRYKPKYHPLFYENEINLKILMDFVEKFETLTGPRKLFLIHHMVYLTYFERLATYPHQNQFWLCYTMYGLSSPKKLTVTDQIFIALIWAKLDKKSTLYDLTFSDYLKNYLKWRSKCTNINIRGVYFLYSRSYSKPDYRGIIYPMKIYPCVLSRKMFFR